MTEAEEWTGEVIADLHRLRISQKQLAVEAGVTQEYISMLLNGKRKSEPGKKRILSALQRMKNKEALTNVNAAILSNHPAQHCD